MSAPWDVPERPCRWCGKQIREAVPEDGYDKDVQSVHVNDGRLGCDNDYYDEISGWLVEASRAE